jgi:hypothetical protein
VIAIEAHGRLAWGEYLWMHDYDKSSKWLIQHHGDSILRLAGVADIATWRPLQAEVVQPLRLPDGLIEVYHQGQTEPDWFVLELATYPDARIAQQAVRDTTLVYHDRGVVPELLVLVLHPKGNQRAAGSADLRSTGGAGHGGRRRGKWWSSGPYQPQTYWRLAT